MNSLLWLRQDLRLHDNPALAAAISQGKPVICVYIHDDINAGANADGAATKVWLHHALAVLKEQLAEKNLSLHLAVGDSLAILPALCKTYEISNIYTNTHYEPWRQNLDSDLREKLSAQGVAWHSHSANVLVEPDALKTKTGGNFKVFTPFYKALLERGVEGDAPAPLPAKAISIPLENSCSIEELALLPRSEPDWHKGLISHWRVGEEAAHDMLATFLEDKGDNYKIKRDFPDLDITSRLSPYLHFGHISPRQIWRLCQQNGSPKLEAFTRQLVWRDFSIQLLHFNPEMDSKPLQPQFAHFPWQVSKEYLTAWQRGMTGYPIVDAGMRQLWATGWMHNRVRMVVASFLVKHLLQPWQDGEAWFWDTLVDADLANNAASWQWVAGCGADAAPYFRVFNPILQGVKFDPDGRFIRRWCPELVHMPTEHIHTPWEAPLLMGDYPPPIVDHAQARDRALAAYHHLKNEPNG